MDLSNLIATTQAKMVPKVFDNIFDTDPVLMRLMGKAEQGSGYRLELPILYSKVSAGGWVSDMDVVDTAREETKTKAVFDWKLISQPVTLSFQEISKNSGKEQIIDLVKQSLEEGKMNLKDKLVTSLYSDGTGSSSKEIAGLEAICDDSTNVNVYGDINRTNYTWWKANYTASSGETTLAKIGAMYDSCSSGSQQPTLIVTTVAIWRAMEQLLNADKRFGMTSDGPKRMFKNKETGEIEIGMGNEMKADGSFSTIFFQGAPVVASDYCPSGHMFFLNEHTIKFYYLPIPGIKTDKYGFGVTEELKPTNQLGSVRHLVWQGALACTEPRKNGQLRDLS